MADNSLNDKYLDQAKWILTPNNVKHPLDCPLVSGCLHCLVYDYVINVNGCPIEFKIKAANHYLRTEKLKRISK